MAGDVILGRSDVLAGTIGAGVKTSLWSKIGTLRSQLMKIHDGVAVRKAPFIQPLASGVVKYREDTIKPPTQGTEQRAKVGAARILVTLQQGSLSVHIKPSFCLYRLDQDSSASDVPGALHVPHVSPRAAYARNAKHGVENAENHIHGRQAFRGIARRAFLYIAQFRTDLATGQS
ncbi:hypothetical protein LTS16_026814 [Friedmanniomyces endolithicus]|nr:hypothetical protein LTR57_024363 [Friedmanniomyces endolithicus]KAK1020958.1 hypothetical protein LTS16_026814 [Friedmanniomyces endolithicus]